MSYITLTAVSAMVTFIVLRKGNKTLHWEELHSLLEPDERDPQQRCFVSHFLFCLCV